ncbi:MAG: cytochrome c maturation protein CcmE [candidate division NC10 bacterium]|nr:cytochrome c maturation protein CcmE [candidate division NC10 bacterium]MBI2114831.1 cytochrome c maturation protein CcmE [candidate division NC10 bacterium]MBI2162759.1 cytochrome c maturation protein CcmE [candidate division NC10 bacterium]MBI2563313.1 cytochrome c maturation protein CcmE [candidate division NC10 bacterium]MBI3086256.1 cytochrome c maturation protein CcmE [candidate division NC10 bacterium]
MKKRKLKYLLAGGIVVAALAGMIYSGVQESMVYFYTPSELVQKKDAVQGKSLRVGGMVVERSIRWDPQTLLLTFQLTDGQGTVFVRHKGTAPDLFKEGAGAVVEGTWTPEGFFRSSNIMAKHSEEYKPPAHPETLESKKELFKSILKEGKP